MNSFRQPSHIGIGSAFTVKVEWSRKHGDQTILHVCDKKRECEFYIEPEDQMMTNYQKLVYIIEAEPSTFGTKVYISSVFDQNGNCSLYVNRRKIKTW
jgi:hypothetical protein